MSFHNRTYASRRGFIKEYEKEHGKKPDLQHLSPLLLSEFQNAILNADDDHLKCLTAIVGYVKNDKSKKTLLHYAAKNNQVEVVRYLLEHGSAVNASDFDGKTPLHVAAENAYKDIMGILLDHGAIFNSTDLKDRKPFDMSNNEEIREILTVTEHFMEAAMYNICSGVDRKIREGAFVNARHAKNETALHHAAMKGYDNLVDILLSNRANPNFFGMRGFTPLHYAAKCAHGDIAKSLLKHGAIFSAVNDDGKTALDVTEDKDLIGLFKSIKDFFEKVKSNNSNVVTSINEIKNMDTVKAIMGAKNDESRTLIEAAVLGNFSKIDELKNVCQDDVFKKMKKGMNLLENGKFEGALTCFKMALKKRIEFVGPDNPATWDIQKSIAEALKKLKKYQEAVEVLEEIYTKEVKSFGRDFADTLTTRDVVGYTLQRWGKYEKALELYEDVIKRKIHLLGENHPATITSLFNKGLLLNSSEKYDDALTIFRETYNKRKQVLGPDHLDTIHTQHVLALALSRQGSQEEALEMSKDAFSNMKFHFDLNHDQTRGVLHTMASILTKLEKHSEAVEIYESILSMQTNILPANHPDLLKSKFDLARGLVRDRNIGRALGLFKDILEPSKSVFSPDHEIPVKCQEGIECFESTLHDDDEDCSHGSHCDCCSSENYYDDDDYDDDDDEWEDWEYLKDDLLDAVVEGDVEEVKWVLDNEGDVNWKFENGRTSLHLAVSHSHIDVVKTLLDYGADVTEVTDKGNTALHTAVLNGSEEIVELLLRKVAPEKMVEFVNAKTVSGETTALHVAAKSGLYAIVKLLLANGAIFEAVNKDGKLPIDLSTDLRITDLLKTVSDVFEECGNGDSTAFLKKFGRLLGERDEFSAVSTARDRNGRNLQEVALSHNIVILLSNTPSNEELEFEEIE